MEFTRIAQATQHHAQTLKQARPASLAFWQGFREHGSGAYEGTSAPARSEDEAETQNRLAG